MGFLSRVVGWFLWLGSAAFSLLGLYVKAVGASTTPEDTWLLPEKGRVVLTFIADQPALAFYGFFLVLGALGLWLAFRKSEKSALVLVDEI